MLNQQKKFVLCVHLFLFFKPKTKAGQPQSQSVIITRITSLELNNDDDFKSVLKTLNLKDR